MQVTNARTLSSSSRFHTFGCLEIQCSECTNIYVGANRTMTLNALSLLSLLEDRSASLLACAQVEAFLHGKPPAGATMKRTPGSSPDSIIITAGVIDYLQVGAARLTILLNAYACLCFPFASSSPLAFSFFSFLLSFLYAQCFPCLGSMGLRYVPIVNIV